MFSDEFEDKKILESDSESTEFSDDYDWISLELAYTRYYLAKAEMNLGKLGLGDLCKIK